MKTNPSEIISNPKTLTLRNADAFRRGFKSFAKYCIVVLNPHDTWMEAPITDFKDDEVDSRLDPSTPARQFFIGSHHVSTAENQIAIDDAIFKWPAERVEFRAFLRAPMPATRVPSRNA